MRGKEKEGEGEGEGGERDWLTLDRRRSHRESTGIKRGRIDLREYYENSGFHLEEMDSLAGRADGDVIAFIKKKKSIALASVLRIDSS